MAKPIKGMKFQNWFIPAEGARCAWALIQSTHPRYKSMELNWWLEAFDKGKPQKIDGKEEVLRNKWGIVGIEESIFEHNEIKTYESRILLLEKGARMYDEAKKYWAKMGDWGVPVYEKYWMNFV